MCRSTLALVDLRQRQIHSEVTDSHGWDGVSHLMVPVVYYRGVRS